MIKSELTQPSHNASKGKAVKYSDVFPFSKWYFLGLFGIAILVFLIAHSFKFNDIPNGWRATQTAMSIRYMVEDGFKLAYSTPVMGKPYAIPMEFPLYQYIAGLLVYFGISIGHAGILLSVASTLGSAGILYLLTRKIVRGRFQSLLLPIIFLISPKSLEYSHLVLIETFAVFLSLCFLYTIYSAFGGNRVWLGLALFVGVLAAIVKITTLIAVTPLGILLYLHYTHINGRKVWYQIRKDIWLLVLLVSVPLFFGVLWTQFADNIKEQNSLASIITSHALKTFNFGTLQQRLTPATWQTIVSRNAFPFWLALVGVVYLKQTKHSYFIPAIGLLLAFFFGPLVFTNLYQHDGHDYYSAANAFMLSCSAGFAAIALFEANSEMIKRLAAWVVIPIILVSSVYNYSSVYGSGAIGVRLLPSADAIALLTKPSDPVIIYGQFWNPEIGYYANRRSLSVGCAWEYGQTLSVTDSLILLAKAKQPLSAYKAFALYYTKDYDNVMITNWLTETRLDVRPVMLDPNQNDFTLFASADAVASNLDTLRFLSTKIAGFKTGYGALITGTKSKQDLWAIWHRPDIFIYKAQRTSADWDIYLFRIFNGLQAPNPDGSQEFLAKHQVDWLQFQEDFKVGGGILTD